MEKRQKAVPWIAGVTAFTLSGTLLLGYLAIKDLRRDFETWRSHHVQYSAVLDSASIAHDSLDWVRDSTYAADIEVLKKRALNYSSAIDSLKHRMSYIDGE